jgi:D-3-phosphoglycerate dehydrogenase
MEKGNFEVKKDLYISGIDFVDSELEKKLKAFCNLKYVQIGGEQELKAALMKCDIFWFRLNHTLTKDLLEGIRTKIIVCAATGLDHIDTDFCDKIGIKIISLKNKGHLLSNITATAELALMLMLMLVRESKYVSSHVENGSWDRNQFCGHELRGKSLGILGYGRLGKIMAQYGDSLGMKVYFFDSDDKITAISESHIKADNLEEFFKKIDILSIHVPLNKSNIGMLNRDLMSLMKNGALIVNTSRGAIVNESDLIFQLKSKLLGGYATDVLTDEPDTRVSELLRFSMGRANVIITPHIGGFTHESVYKAEEIVVNDLIDHLKLY